MGNLKLAAGDYSTGKTIYKVMWYLYINILFWKRFFKFAAGDYSNGEEKFMSHPLNLFWVKVNTVRVIKLSLPLE